MRQWSISSRFTVTGKIKRDQIFQPYVRFDGLKKLYDYCKDNELGTQYSSCICNLAL